MTRSRCLAPILGGLLLLSAAGLQAQPADTGIGFVLESTDFGDPCTSEPGGYPVIYDNHTKHAVDVSFKIVNTGGSNVFVSGTGFVIPPQGPQRRPRIIRLTVEAGEAIKLHGQADDCAWTATVRPH